METLKIPIRYLPKRLTNVDKKKQMKMLLKSRRLYKKNKYFTRKRVPSFTSRKSNHIIDAQRIYHIDKIVPSKELAKATGCSVEALSKIVKKGEGAYFSSGSRPNQTAQSWGYARLASAISSGKAAAVDYHILEKGCNHNKKAFRLARQSVKKYKHGQSKTKKIEYILKD
jgi:DNA-binding Xre family transcriptional regulator